MAFVNDKLQEINCKIIYYGPPSSGKATTLFAIANRIDPKNRLSSLSKNNKSLYFDFVPVVLGKWRGYTVRLHLYTAPADWGYESSNRLIATGADAVVFVVDSQITRVEDNAFAFSDLRRTLNSSGFENLPIIFQYNKQDLPEAVKADDLSTLLNKDRRPEFASVAIRGEGIMEPLFAASREALKRLESRSDK